MARGPRRATTLGGHPRVQGDDASLEIVITLEMEGVQEGTNSTSYSQEGATARRSQGGNTTPDTPRMDATQGGPDGKSQEGNTMMKEGEAASTGARSTRRMPQSSIGHQQVPQDYHQQGGDIEYSQDRQHREGDG